MLAVAQIAAQWLIWLGAAGLALWCLRSGPAGRVTIIRTGTATLLALAINFTIAALWYHPRLFEFGLGHKLLPDTAEASFPSDHETVHFAVDFGLMAFGAGRVWWSLALYAALAVAWARVWFGVHWPLDMLGSAGVAAVAIVVLRGVARYPVMGKFDKVILGLADAVLAFLRAPPSLAPRFADGTHAMAEQALGQGSGD